jgi:hypothetical protein
MAPNDQISGQGVTYVKVMTMMRATGLRPAGLDLTALSDDMSFQIDDSPSSEFCTIGFSVWLSGQYHFALRARSYCLPYLFVDFLFSHLLVVFRLSFTQIASTSTLSFICSGASVSHEAPIALASSGAPDIWIAGSLAAETKIFGSTSYVFLHS